MRFLFLSTFLFIEANSLVMSQNSRAAAKKPKSSHNVPASGVRADDVERCARPRDVKKDALDSWSTSLSADVNDASAQFIIDEVKAHAKETVPRFHGKTGGRSVSLSVDSGIGSVRCVCCKGWVLIWGY